MNTARRGILALAACQALLVTSNITVVSLSGLVGVRLAPDPAMALLPTATFVAGAALSTLPLSLRMGSHGRRAGFSLGALAGIAGAALCALALALGSFPLFCLGTAVIGAYSAAGGYYRFAAADLAPEAGRSRAVSLVLAGGMLGGVLGPESSKLTRDLTSVPFQGCYLALLGFGALALVLARHMPLAAPARRGDIGPPPRRLGQLLGQPAYLVAALGALTSYGVMNLLMGATPLAMQTCALPYAATTLAVEWHIIGMFAPALVAGSLVQRLGPPRVMAAGVAVMACSVGAALAGRSAAHFWAASTLLGVGWCLLYVGSTVLLTQAYHASEKARAQGINDMAVFVAMGVASAISGPILHHQGWSVLNLCALPLLVAAGLALPALALARGRAARA